MQAPALPWRGSEAWPLPGNVGDRMARWRLPDRLVPSLQLAPPSDSGRRAEP